MRDLFFFYIVNQHLVKLIGLHLKLERSPCASRLATALPSIYHSHAISIIAKMEQLFPHSCYGLQNNSAFS
jgi:hypothetical protein